MSFSATLEAKLVSACALYNVSYRFWTKDSPSTVWGRAPTNTRIVINKGTSEVLAVQFKRGRVDKFLDKGFVNYTFTLGIGTLCMQA
jgi:hypothetical protein